MKLYITLAGTSKHAAALIMPCGSYKFLYDPETNLHVLEGGPLTVARFNEAFADMVQRWPESQYRAAPLIVEDDIATADAIPPAPEPATWEQEKAALTARLERAHQELAKQAARKPQPVPV